MCSIEIPLLRKSKSHCELLYKLEQKAVSHSILGVSVPQGEQKRKNQFASLPMVFLIWYPLQKGHWNNFHSFNTLNQMDPIYSYSRN